MVKEFRIGEIFGKSLSTFIANFIPFMVIGVVVFLPSIAYDFYYLKSLEGLSPAETSRAETTYNVVTRLLNLVLSPLQTGAITYGVFQHLRGKRASLGECLSVGFSRLLPVLGVAIVSGLIVGFGFLLLIVPGIIFYCTYYVAVPAAVVERQGVRASLDRSKGLTQGQRWKICGLLLLILLVQFGMGILLGLGLSGAAASPMVVTAMIILIQIIASTWGSTASCISYYHLRSMKESVDIEDVASVFD